MVKETDCLFTSFVFSSKFYASILLYTVWAGTAIERPKESMTFQLKKKTKNVGAGKIGLEMGPN